MTAKSAAAPLSRPFRVDRLPRDRAGIVIKATPEEEAALAADFRIPAIRDLVGQLQWSGTSAHLVITGTVSAIVTQVCTISLEPFEAEVSEPVEIVFSDREPEKDVGDEEADVPDPIVNGTIDLGQVTAEFLALGLDPYPRKPGIAFEPVAEERESPLAILKTLKHDDA
ncbi:hypothetical protein MBUL_02357 [Methylobacterium bullatum]|uniref:Large ribosomal RNA subunit accumulation protein YceD n=1 Tax=Methylobacterium bullatum TaxID=570505 RepID=A0A679ITH6_9HYPH|nr:hypothetical protein MBUL_02357 [Methylobacterium bullatum]